MCSRPRFKTWAQLAAERQQQRVAAAAIEKQAAQAAKALQKAEEVPVKPEDRTRVDERPANVPGPPTASGAPPGQAPAHNDRRGEWRLRCGRGPGKGLQRQSSPPQGSAEELYAAQVRDWGHGQRRGRG
eukprot:gene1219-1753_t